MVLFLQRHSIVQLVLHLDLFVRAETIYLYGRERRFSVFDVLGLSAKLGALALWALRFQDRVKPIDPELFAPELWKANHESIELARRCAGDITRQDSYAFLSRYLADDPNLIKYYEARVVLYVSRALHMVRLVEILARTQTTYALLGSEEFTDLPSAPRLFERIRRMRPKRSRLLGALSKRVYGMWYRAQWLCLPSVRLMVLLPRLRLRNTAIRSYTLMIQMLWGAPVKDSQETTAGRTPKHDFYLYSARIRPGEILHYYDGSWVFDIAARARNNAYMQAHSCSWAERADLTASPAHVWRLLRLQVRLLLHAARHGFLLLDSASVQNLSARALWEVLVRELDLDHFRWLVVFDRSDYNPRHIVDTIVLNRSQMKTVGLHHCASPYDCPQLAFVHYDHYIAIGELFERPYRPWWRQDMIVRIGRNNLDWVVRPRLDQGLSDSLRSRFERTHGVYRHRVVLVLPGDVYYLFPRRWRELENGLHRFLDSNLDMVVVVRFKTTKTIQESPNLRRLWTLCQTDPRLVVDQSGFSLYELMAISDMVLTPNCSSAINEAVALDVPVFTFDFHGRTPLVFRDYDDDFVISTGTELFDRLRFLPREVGRRRLGWERLKKEANYTSDGRNHERTSNFVALVALGGGASVESSRVSGGPDTDVPRGRSVSHG